MMQIAVRNVVIDKQMKCYGIKNFLYLYVVIITNPSRRGFLWKYMSNEDYCVLEFLLVILLAELFQCIQQGINYE